MSDVLFLSVWFPSFAEAEMMPQTLTVLRQFPFSAARPGISYLAVQPISWAEPTVVERRFNPGLDPESATALAGEFLHSDYAYVFETHWDLWDPATPADEPVRSPVQVKFIAHGTDFEDNAYEQAGHLQIDLGLDAPFLYDEHELTALTEQQVVANVQKLVSFTSAVEKNCGIRGRVLWSESNENLAQKLIERLQRMQ
jgi:hypothetical protein